MSLEISIHADAATLLAELKHLVVYLQALRHERCEVLFGWPRGMDYYPTSQWVAETIPLADVESKVQQAENAGLGRLGGDDLAVTVAGLDREFCFCHHSGIHLTFTQPGQVANDLLARWRSGGLSPVARDTTLGRRAEGSE